MAQMALRQFRELAAAVMRNLPEIPSEEAQLLIEEQERLSAILRNAFGSSKQNDFQIVMDGSIPWSDEGLEVWGRVGVENGDGWLSGHQADGFYAQAWPKPSDSPRVYQLALVKPGYAMSGHAAVRMLGKTGFRLATLIETTWFLCQWENFIKGGHYCEKPLLSMEDVQPLVMSAGAPDDPDYLSVVSSGEMHSDFIGRVMLDDATYVAIKPWGSRLV